MAATSEVTQRSEAQREAANSGRWTAKLIGWRILTILTGAIFIYAGTIKAVNPLRFANDISNYHLLPWPIGVRLAFYLPWLEIISGLAVLTGVLRRGAVAVLGSMMCVFIAASVIAKARGINVSCGCFGVASEKLSFASHLALDALILGAIIALWFAGPLHARRL
jgi:uncharacterized membrane protein YphA (DoxX/SURF4 family)